MAKLCCYGTSPPVSSLFCDFPDDYYVNPDPFGFLDDLPSICGDIQKMESDLGNSDCSSYECGGVMEFDDIDTKPEVRNTALMWPALPSDKLSSSVSSMTSDISTAVPLSAVMDNMQVKPERPSNQEQLQRSPPTVVTAKNFGYSMVIKQEPDVEQELEHHSIPNNKVAMSPTTPSMNNIPPGTSLLRKSANQQQQKKTQQTRAGTIHITKRGDQLLPSATINPASYTFTSSSSPSLNTSSSSSNSSVSQRPDTPESLDDNCSTPEFIHNVDLRACVMGSNNISLTSDHTTFIDSVSQELQDTSKKQIDTRLISGCSLTEVLDVINSTTSESTTTSTTSTGVDTLGSYSSCLSVNKSGSLRSSDFDSDEESSNSSLSYPEISHSDGGVSPVSSQSSNYMQHTDHCYTLPNDGAQNLETPSDSDEEIDVVSVNDKKLPTNPSDKDRRALQTKVAHKFKTTHIVKTPNGVRTIPPRRRGSYEFPYTPASNSPVKSVNNSRFPSPTATPYQNQYTTKYVQQQQQQMVGNVVTDSTTYSTISILNTDKSRKRLLANGTLSASNAGTIIINGEIIGNGSLASSLPPSKKHRGKKTKQHVVQQAVQLQQSAVLKRHYSIDETADTIEKRNLHNDMERQRRIGLKNLFEALKKQIPSIKDKERAPKVNILREAAKLCESLTKEDQQLNEQKAKLKEEMRRKQELLNQLRQLQRD